MVKKSILIVEDDESVREAYEAFFGDFDIDLSSAGNLEDALEYSKRKKV